jgi:hypothetical protein
VQRSGIAFESQQLIIREQLIIRGAIIILAVALARRK